MRWLPVIAFFLLIYIEISLFVKIAVVCGVLFTLLLAIASSCFGISLIRRHGVNALRQLQEKLSAGDNPAMEMVTSASLLIAGFLLLLPGFLTDTLGLLLLFPPAQQLVVRYFLPRMSRFRHTTHQRAGAHSSEHQGRTLEGEFQRKDEE